MLTASPPGLCNDTGYGLDIHHLTLRSLVLAAAVLVAAPVLGEASMYRYRNDKGILVVDFSIPPKYVSEGYEVLTTTGRLIRKVPPRDPSLTQQAIEQREAQEKEDNYILRSYSSLEAIERARDRKVILVEREIEILQSNLEDFAQRRVEMREKAAGYQASGRETPEAIDDILVDLDVHEENTRELLKERRRELRDIKQRYDRYAERLLALRPELANSVSAKAEKDSPQ